MAIPIFKNEDRKITIIFRDKISGVPLDLNTLTGWGVWLYYHTDIVWLKYSHNTIAVDGVDLVAQGFKPIQVVDAKQGKFKIIIEAKDTNVANSGYVGLDYKVQYSDTEVSTGIFHRIGRPIQYFAEIFENVTQSTTNL